MSSDTTRGQSSWFRPLDSTDTSTCSHSSCCVPPGPVNSNRRLVQMWSRKSSIIFWFSSAPMKRFHLSVFTRSTQNACSRRKSTLSSKTTPTLREGSWGTRTTPVPLLPRRALLLPLPGASAIMKTPLEKCSHDLEPNPVTRAAGGIRGGNMWTEFVCLCLRLRAGGVSHGCLCTLYLSSFEPTDSTSKSAHLTDLMPNVSLALRGYREPDQKKRSLDKGDKWSQRGSQWIDKEKRTWMFKT